MPRTRPHDTAEARIVTTITAVLAVGVTAKNGRPLSMHNTYKAFIGPTDLEDQVTRIPNKAMMLNSVTNFDTVILLHTQSDP